MDDLSVDLRTVPLWAEVKYTISTEGEGTVSIPFSVPEGATEDEIYATAKQAALAGQGRWAFDGEVIMPTTLPKVDISVLNLYENAIEEDGLDMPDYDHPISFERDSWAD